MYDMAARVILMGGDKYFDEVTRMVTSGLYTKPSNRIVAKAAHGLLQPTPKALDRVKFEDLVEGLRFYLLTLTSDGKKMSLDATYNLASYAHQLIFKLDETKQFEHDYVMQCVNIMEHGHTLHGVDPPTGITATWSVGNPKQVEIEGAIYRLKPGNATRFPARTNQRDIWRPECLICGMGLHHTNEHDSRIVFIERDYNQTLPEARLKPRRVENFIAPGEVLRPQFYSDVVYVNEDGQHVVGNRYRREDPTRHTVTTYATVTESGQITSSSEALVEEANFNANRETRPPTSRTGNTTHPTLPRRPAYTLGALPRGNRNRGQSVQPEPMAGPSRPTRHTQPQTGPSTLPG